MARKGRRFVYVIFNCLQADLYIPSGDRHTSVLESKPRKLRLICVTVQVESHWCDTIHIYWLYTSVAVGAAGALCVRMSGIVG